MYIYSIVGHSPRLFVFDFFETSVDCTSMPCVFGLCVARTCAHGDIAIVVNKTVLYHGGKYKEKAAD